MNPGARLVVLSACETGKGLAHGSEGILALDRSFLVAGAGAVVSSLWVVQDDATTALMERFYGGLASGRPADVALADAMQTVRRMPRWADPIHWAAFRVSPPVSVGTSSTGITGHQGPTRWHGSSSSPAPTDARMGHTARPTFVDGGRPRLGSVLENRMPDAAGAVEGELAALGACGAP